MVKAANGQVNSLVFKLKMADRTQDSREIIKLTAVCDAVIGQKYSHHMTAVHTLQCRLKVSGAKRVATLYINHHHHHFIRSVAVADNRTIQKKTR